MKDFFLVGLLEAPSKTKKTRDRQAKELAKKVNVLDKQVHLLPPEDFEIVKDWCQGQTAQEPENELSEPWIC